MKIKKKLKKYMIPYNTKVKKLFEFIEIIKIYFDNSL